MLEIYINKIGLINFIVYLFLLISILTLFIVVIYGLFQKNYFKNNILNKLIDFSIKFDSKKIQNSLNKNITDFKDKFEQKEKQFIENLEKKKHQQEIENNLKFEQLRKEYKNRKKEFKKKEKIEKELQEKETLRQNTEQNEIENINKLFYKKYYESLKIFEERKKSNINQSKENQFIKQIIEIEKQNSEILNCEYDISIKLNFENILFDSPVTQIYYINDERKNKEILINLDYNDNNTKLKNIDLSGIEGIQEYGYYIDEIYQAENIKIVEQKTNQNDSINYDIGEINISNKIENKIGTIQDGDENDINFNEFVKGLNSIGTNNINQRKKFNIPGSILIYIDILNKGINSIMIEANANSLSTKEVMIKSFNKLFSKNEFSSEEEFIEEVNRCEKLFNDLKWDREVTPKMRVEADNLSQMLKNLNIEKRLNKEEK